LRMVAIVVAGFFGFQIPWVVYPPMRTNSWYRDWLPSGLNLLWQEVISLSLLVLVQILAYLLLRRFDRAVGRVYGISALIGSITAVGLWYTLVAMFWIHGQPGGL